MQPLGALTLKKLGDDQLVKESQGAAKWEGVERAMDFRAVPCALFLTKLKVNPRSNENM